MYDNICMCVLVQVRNDLDEAHDNGELLPQLKLFFLYLGRKISD